jgi:thiamine biosynthesis protein ThiS
MQVRVNGEVMTLPDGATVAELLRRVEADPTQVAVERNLDVVPRRSYNEAALADGDEIEIVTFVGGG